MSLYQTQVSPFWLNIFQVYIIWSYTPAWEYTHCSVDIINGHFIQTGHFIRENTRYVYFMHIISHVQSHLRLFRTFLINLARFQASAILWIQLLAIGFTVKWPVYKWPFYTAVGLAILYSCWPWLCKVSWIMLMLAIILVLIKWPMYTYWIIWIKPVN